MAQSSVFADRAITSRNITIVYDSLDLGLINVESLRKVVAPTGSLATLPQFEAIVGTLPDHNVVFELGSRRLNLTSQKHSAAADDVPLWDLVTSIHKAVPAERSRVEAFGFNYDVLLTMREHIDIGLLLVQHFGDMKKLGILLEGDPLALQMGYVYQRDARLHQLRLQPVDPLHLVVHLNVHVNTGTLPTGEELRELFINEFDHLTRVEKGLLAGLPA